MFAPIAGNISAGYFERPKALLKPASTLWEKIKRFIAEIFRRLSALFSRSRPTSKKIEVLYRLSSSIKTFSTRPYWILSLDGGGTRAMIPLQKLKMIEKLTGKKIVELFDCIAGTSTGGIMAAGLCLPDPKDPTKTLYTAAQVEELYDKFAGEIFTSSIWHRVSSLWGTFEAKYPSPDGVFRQIAGAQKIGDCTVTKMLITSVDLLTGRLVLFENRPQNSVESLLKNRINAVSTSQDTPLATGLEGSSAAPTYFPTRKLGNLNLADGGLALNNPAEIAALLAMNGEAKGRPIMILSLGTGKNPNQPVMSPGPLNWGVAQWTAPLVNYLLEFNANNVDQQLELLSNANPQIGYIRLQDILKDGAEEELDNASPENLLKLKELGKKSFDHYLANGGEKLIEMLMQE